MDVNVRGSYWIETFGTYHICACSTARSSVGYVGASLSGRIGSDLSSLGSGWVERSGFIQKEKKKR